MQIVRSRLFTESLERLRTSDPNLFIATAADLRYLIEKRRAAELPQVRFGLAQSRHRILMGEVRTHIPGHLAFVRTIFAMPSDESICAFLLLGDKNSQTAGAAIGNDWYDEAVPLADSLWEALEASQSQGDIPE